MFQAFAQTTAPECQDATEIRTDFGCVPGDPIGFVQEMYGIGFSILAMVVLLHLVIGGYHLMTSQGSPERIQKGRDYIFYSIAGLLLGIFGFVLIQIAARDLLRIPGF